MDPFYFDGHHHSPYTLEDMLGDWNASQPLPDWLPQFMNEFEQAVRTNPQLDDIFNMLDELEAPLTDQAETAVAATIAQVATDALATGGLDAVVDVFEFWGPFIESYYATGTVTIEAGDFGGGGGGGNERTSGEPVPVDEDNLVPEEVS